MRKREANGRSLGAAKAPTEESGFVVLCDSAQGAIVETISQLFLPACDRPVGLMWEPCTPPPTRRHSEPTVPEAESAGGKGVCAAVASERESE